MALAMAKAAPAATLPIRVVCKALRRGLVPVKRPFINPKTNSASRVNTMDSSNAPEAVGEKK